ncbi:mannitol dehydrogenase family protein [Parenemella sanctibonifatiensis]|nr:mannitol dehydrogenase family protein [Parenemella sanctibonifatiensis]
MTEQPRIVHLGLGNFHRAHQAVYTADAAGQPWRITAVARSNRQLVETLKAQNMSYTIVEVGPGAAEPRRMTVIDRALVAKDEPAAVRAAIADPECHVVTLTITEKGYGYKPGSSDLDVEAAGVREDAAGLGDADRVPATMLAVLAGGLLDRADSGNPITLVSCDNVGHNGTGLGRLLRQFAALLPAEQGDKLTAYLDASVSTPNTMVDRIVPATTDKHRDMAAEAGFEDQIPVPGEPFTMWVLEDDFAGPHPDWASSGAILSDQVDRYELVKLRLLNAANSMLAYLGLLNGGTFIAEGAVNDAIKAATWQLGEEMQPTITLPDGFDPIEYRKELFVRFSNLELGHTCQQVGSDGSAKLTQRVPGPVAWHAEHGDPAPKALVLLTAAWLSAVVYADLPEGNVPDEPARDLLKQLAEGGVDQLAKAALVDHAVLGPQLAEQTAFVEAVSAQLVALQEKGLAAVLADF